MPTNAAAREPLERYSAKRDFSVTPEPKGVRAGAAKELSFVVQKHWASRLHYDFRLELDGVLLSWAVPKGPSYDPRDKRMAIHVEDHPVAYGSFEGTIPKGQYGAGTVIVWDRGTWEPVGDAHEGMRSGKLAFRLHGEKLAGMWELIRIAKPGDRQDPWMLFKKRDEWARPAAEYDVVAALPDSVVVKPLGPVEQREPRGGEAAAPAKPRVSARPTSAAEVPGAVEAPLPDQLSPQLAMLASAAPAGEWLCEVKFDGYRLLARIDGSDVRLITRKGNDWTDKMKPLAEAVKALGLRSAWLDGEIVVLRDDGTQDFNALQNAFDSRRTGEIVFFLFDVPFVDGYDLRHAALRDRRALLRELLGSKGGERLRFSEHFSGEPAHVLRSACAMKLEGIIAKRADAPYVCKRADTWLKLKCHAQQEFVVCGFTDRAGSKHEIGSLMLGYHDADGKLRPAGSVGTGWDAAAAASLHARLSLIETVESPFEAAATKPGRWTRRRAADERWVEPKLVAEVAFADWTPDGLIRHSIFKGLRDDKPARSIKREQVVAAPRGQARAAAKQLPAEKATKVKVSNPDRVIDASTGLKKIDLVRYYESVAEWMLPHLRHRPVSFVRGPTGIAGQLFFQKHDDKLTIPGVRELDPSFWPEHPPLLEVPSAHAIAGAAQMNVIEFHTWNSTTRHFDKPDRIVFDLDPGEGVKWPHVQEAAFLVRTLLEELGLRSWLKTSGGKGLHVIVPIAPKLDYDTVKDVSQAAVQHLAQTIPSRFVAKSGAANRVGRIFVDYLRNGFGATTAAAFSARARPGLGVSMPVAWEQLPDLKSGSQWGIHTAREYLSFQQSDPWAGYWKSRQTLAKAMKALAFSPQPSTPKAPRKAARAA